MITSDEARELTARALAGKAALFEKEHPILIAKVDAAIREACKHGGRYIKVTLSEVDDYEGLAGFGNYLEHLTSTFICEDVGYGVAGIILTIRW